MRALFFQNGHQNLICLWSGSKSPECVRRSRSGGKEHYSLLFLLVYTIMFKVTDSFRPCNAATMYYSQRGYTKKKKPSHSSSGWWFDAEQNITVWLTTFNFWAYQNSLMMFPSFLRHFYRIPPIFPDWKRVNYVHDFPDGLGTLPHALMTSDLYQNQIISKTCPLTHSICATCRS